MAKADRDTTTTATSDAAMARKRRIAMRNRQRSISTVSASSASSEEEAAAATPTPGQEACRNSKRPRVDLDEEPKPTVVASSSLPFSAAAEEPSSELGVVESMRKKKPHITGIKKQSRYDPGVSMTKAELKAWRKEARRVRNRESAAASRKKNREAIDTLEAQVREVQTKYDAALKHILDLEERLRASGSLSSSSLCPSTAVLRQDVEAMRTASPEHNEEPRLPVSPPESPTASVVALEIFREGAGVSQERTRKQEPPSQWPVRVPNDPAKNAPFHPFSSGHRQSHHPSTLISQKHIIDNTIIRPIAAKISPGAYEKQPTSSANGDVIDDDQPEKTCTTSANDTVVSDDDTTMVSKTSESSPSCDPFSRNNTAGTATIETEISSYSGSDDETVIESDQRLFLDDSTPIPLVANTNTSYHGDSLVGSSATGDDTIGAEDDAIMAEFLKYTFEPSSAAASPDASKVCQNPIECGPAFGEIMDASAMDALLEDENDAIMLLPDICLES